MKYLFISFISLIISYKSIAQWHLEPDLSSVNFVTTKQEHFKELHKIPTLTGSVSQAGELSVQLDLASIDSGIGIRDERMREMLFKVADFQYATITAQIPDFSRKSRLMTIPAKLELQGVSNDIEIQALVTRSAKGEMIATLTQPVLINANDFGLEPGVRALQQVAGLTSISNMVPVYATLVFKKSE